MPEQMRLSSNAHNQIVEKRIEDGKQRHVSVGEPFTNSGDPMIGEILEQVR